MFRQTFIRLILAIFIASGMLVAFAYTRQPQSPEQETCDAPAPDTKKVGQKGEFLILEALGKTLLLKAKSN